MGHSYNPIAYQVLKGWGSRVEFLRVRPYETTSPEPAPPPLLDTISNAVNKAQLWTSYNNLDFSVTENSKHSLPLNFFEGRKCWRNTVFPWLVLCSAWSKWEVISMTCSVFVHHMNCASATFCCSIIKCRSTLKYLLGLHQARPACWRMFSSATWKPDEAEVLQHRVSRLMVLKCAHLPAASFHLTQIPTPFLKPCADVSVSV